MKASEQLQLPGSVRTGSHGGNKSNQQRVIWTCLTLLGIYLLLAPFPSALYRALLWDRQTHSAKDSQVLNVAIYDSFHEHYEIIGPLIYALTRIPNIRLSVYRDHWLYEYPNLLQPCFSGPFLNTRAFFQSPANASHAGNVDILFLPNADLDLRTMLELKIDQYPHLKSAKIVAGVHRTEQWEALPGGTKHRPDGRLAEWTNTIEGQAKMRQAVRQKRLAFMTYAPHVASGLQETLRRNGMGKRVRVETILPVLPNIAGKVRENRIEEKSCRQAVIQGTFNGDRDYERIFADLEQAIRAEPGFWGYDLLPATDIGESEQLVDLAGGSDGNQSGFQLHLLGHLKHYDKAGRGSELLRPVVQLHPNLQYPEYYRMLGEMDVLLPAWVPDSPYLKSRSSSSIPAAIMSRIPVLLSESETRAYAYAEAPVRLRRMEGESEIQAIRRLRAANACGRATGKEWEEYERTIEHVNDIALAAVIR